MKKARLEAFFDAVLAIIMTILILNLALPYAATPAALWALRESFFAYALSFFYIASIWVNLYRQWHDIKRVDASVLWSAIVVLFFTSLVPFVTSFAGEFFYDAFAQVVYTVTLLLVELARYWMNTELARVNASNPEVIETFDAIKAGMRIDMLLKVVGILLSIFVWAPLSMIVIILSTSYITLIIAKYDRLYSEHHPMPDET